MCSRLETVPRDVLQHIAFLAASSTFDPPTTILHLLQTSSTIYRQLDIYAAPDLYARIFYTKFDTGASYRRYGGRLTDSALASELLNRCRLLRRVKRAEFSPCHLMQDLWSALWMVLESDGLNEQQLSAVGFSDFILGLSRAVLVKSNTDQRPRSQALNNLVIWLLCLSLCRGAILDLSKHDRDELFSLIFPFIFLANKIPKASVSASSSVLPSGGDLYGLPHAIGGELNPELIPHQASTPAAIAHVSVYLRQSTPLVPDPSTAAIHLAFIVYEATIMQIPHHLPENRIMANASLRSGPTQEDYRILASYRTPLLADSMPRFGEDDQNTQPLFASMGLSRSMLHDVQFRDVLQVLADLRNDGFQYVPGTMSGVWEGVYRTVDVPTSVAESTKYLNPLMSVVMVKPMQCALAEYLCLEPSVDEGPPNEREIFDDLSAKAANMLNTSELVIGGHRYNKYVPSPRNQTQDQTLEDASAPIYDVILLGETLDDHDQAWGGYKFFGRVQKNGLVILRREAKGANANQPEGIWLFEGCVQSCAALLGRWRISGASVAGSLDHGIFSLGRCTEKWKLEQAEQHHNASSL